MADNNLFILSIVVILFPVLEIILSEVVIRISEESRRLRSSVNILRFCTLPLLVLLFLCGEIDSIPFQNVTKKSLNSLLWMSVLLSILMFLNHVFIRRYGAKNTEGASIPQLFIDLVRFILVLVGIGIILSQVWNTDLGGVLAALGVGSLVIGLALQDTLGNLFSGISLLFEKSYKVGDWVEVGEVKGFVNQINWRSTRIEQRTKEIYIVPNSHFARDGFLNRHLPGSYRIHKETLGFSYSDSPNKIKTILYRLASRTQGVVANEDLAVYINSYDDFSISYDVHLPIENPKDILRIRDSFMTSVWYACRRHGISIPFPIRDVFHHEVGQQSDEISVKRLKDYSKNSPLLSQMLKMDGILEQIEIEDYGTGEVVIENEVVFDYICFVVSGRVSLLSDSTPGVGMIKKGRGALIGNISLRKGELTDYLVKAETDVVLLKIPISYVIATAHTNAHFGRLLSSFAKNERR